MKIKQENRIKYIKNSEKFIKEKKLTKKEIKEYENSIKGSITVPKVPVS